MANSRKLTNEELKKALGVIRIGFDFLTDVNLATQTPDLPFFTIEQLAERVGVRLGEKPTMKEMSLLGNKISELGLPLESTEYQGIMDSYMKHTDRLFPWASARHESRG